MKELARTDLGRIFLEPRVLDRLVREAAEGGGARATAVSLSLEDEGRGKAVVSVRASRKAVLPELGAAIQERLAAALDSLLGASVRVDVTIEGILEEGER